MKKSVYVLVPLLMLGSISTWAYRESDMIGSIQIPTSDTKNSDGVTILGREKAIKSTEVEQEHAKVASQPSSPVSESALSKTSKESALPDPVQTSATQTTVDASYLIGQFKSLIGSDEKIDGPMQHRWP